MLQQKNKFFTFYVYLGDLVATLSAFLLAYWIRSFFPQDSLRVLFPFAQYKNLLWAVFIIWSILFYIVGLYQSWRGPKFWNESWKVFKAVIISFLLLGFAVFAFKFQFVSRIFILLFAVMNIILVLATRVSIRYLILIGHQNIRRFRMILMVGTGAQALTLAKGIDKHKDLGLRILGFISLNDFPEKQELNGYSIVGSSEDFSQILEKEVIDEVIFAVSQDELKNLANLLSLCEERGITSRVPVNFYPYVNAKTYLEELEGIPLLTFMTSPKNEFLLLIRRIFDFLASFLLLVILFPLFLLICLVIRMESSGPLIFRQTRCGLNGRKFMLYKFRSMIQGAEDRKKELESQNLINGPAFKMKNDPRVTRVGRFLRKTSLDELPQLFNVLRGDMSIVGPRPPIPEEVAQYKGWQRRRLSMKPGITGLWQVSGRNLIDFHDWMKLDLEYIDNWSLWLDFKILLKTIPAVFRAKGAM